jgi:hypothetical protein
MLVAQLCRYAQVLTILDRVLPQIHSFGFAIGHPKLWEDLGS